MADSQFVKDSMLPAIQLEADMLVGKVLRALKKMNVEYGVVNKVRGDLFGMVKREKLRPVKANEPVRYFVTNELQAVSIEPDTVLDSIIQEYQENLRLNPALAGFVLRENDVVQGILLRETVEKQALRVEVDLIWRNAQELHGDIERRFPSLQASLAEYDDLLQNVPDFSDESNVTSRQELERQLDENQQLNAEVSHLLRNVQELRIIAGQDKETSHTEVEHLSISVQDLREQLERLLREERDFNEYLVYFRQASRLPGPPVSMVPDSSGVNNPPAPITVECPFCHVKDSVPVYNRRNPPRCRLGHIMNPVV